MATNFCEKMAVYKSGSSALDEMQYERLPWAETVAGFLSPHIMRSSGDIVYCGAYVFVWVTPATKSTKFGSLYILGRRIGTKFCR